MDEYQDRYRTAYQVIEAGFKQSIFTSDLGIDFT